MSTTNDEELKWKKWGNDSEKAPAFKEYIELKEFFELLLKYNNQTKKILEDTKEWLQNTSGNNSR
jgi:hypothetical protein